jgi:hypothetical protein
VIERFRDFRTISLDFFGSLINYRHSICVFTENKIKILSRPWTVNVRDARLFVTNDSGNAFFRTTDRCGCHLQRTPTKKTDKNCFVDSKLLRRPRLDRKLCRRLFRPCCQLVTVHNNLFGCVRANSENVSAFAVVVDNSSSVSKIVVASAVP